MCDREHIHHHDCLPSFEWTPRGHRGLFSIGPLCKVAPRAVANFRPDTSVGKSDLRRAGYVVVSLDDVSVSAKRYQLSRDEIERMASTLADERDCHVIIGEYAGELDDRQPVFRTVARAASALAKAATNPLSPEALDRWIRQAARRLGTEAAQEIPVMLEGMNEWLAFDWDEAGTAQWNAVRQGMTSVFSNPSNPMILSQRFKTGKVLERVLRRVTGATVRLPEMRGRVAATFSLRNPAISQAMMRHHGFYVRNQYGAIAPGLSRQVQDTITRGLEQGLGRREIEKILKGQVTGGLRQPHYWRTVAANATTRARSYAMGSSYQAAGVEFFEIEAIIDEVTTETCMMLHGQLIRVGPAMDRQNAILASPEPEAVQDNQPFIGLNSDGEFRTELSDGTSTVIATREPPSGGENPRYTRVSGKEMADAGVGFPGYHHMCRSTTVPVI